jgi:ribosomal protein S18 acetylase RimI-like enzyme
MIGTPSKYSKTKLIGINSPEFLREGGYFANLKKDGIIVASLYVNKYHESYIIRDVFVLESERSKGYGKKIMQEILDFLKFKNKRVILYVDPKNKIALSLYENLGFKLDKKNSAYGDRLILE